jgi:putative tryptophan/tyrosine transport system substrate-binding protein
MHSAGRRIVFRLSTLELMAFITTSRGSIFSAHIGAVVRRIGGCYMQRRDFVTLLGSTAITWPLAARAQQSVMPVIGFLSSPPPDLHSARLRGFHQGLKGAGYVEGQNVAIEYRWADDQYDRLPALAAELVRRQVNVIAAGGIPTALAAKAATATIPIVFGVAIDPVEIGLVASLNRPGGNATGITDLNKEVGPKRMELLHELIPTATMVALLVNPTNPNAKTIVRDAQVAARALGLQLHVLHASSDRDLDTVFATVAQLRVGALVIGADPFFTSRSPRLAKLTVDHAVPTIYEFREFAASGGLISYGSDELEYYRLVGIYTGKILKGEKPADLPVVRSTKVELIINLKTAKGLGLTVPLSLLGRADEVIE